MNTSLILEHSDIALKLDRIAWQILEEHYGQKKIVLVGLADKGVFLAKELEQRLKAISKLEVSVLDIIVDKDAPLKSKVEFSGGKNVSNKAVILVDDVLNSGKTLIAALKEVLNYQPTQVSVAVLANRDHHKFPIEANFVGISLATTLQEHISFKLEDGKMSVWLD